MARANTARLGLDVPIAQSPGCAGTYDLVVAKLPYVTVGGVRGAGSRDPVVRAPRRAGRRPRRSRGDRRLVAAAPPGTRLALERGAGQGEAVRALLAGPETHRDLAGHDRVTVGAVR